MFLANLIKLYYYIVRRFLKENHFFKEVLELRFLEDKSYKEISDILKKPEGTIATLISRAKKKFHQEYEKR